MVSLGDDRHSPGGGYFFDASASQTFDETDEASLVSSVLIVDSEPHYRSIPITGVLALKILSVLAMLISAFIVPNFIYSDACFILNCLHVGLWCVFVAAYFYLQHQHGIILHYGYIEFNRKTQIFQKIPFLIISFGNTMLLICAELFKKFCPNSEVCPSEDTMHCHHYVQMIFFAEFLVIFPCLVRYIILVIQFNRNKVEPDVHQEELLASCLHSQAPVNEIGFRDEDYMEEILEKQADMIRYFKQHNIHLSRKILKLTVQMNSLQNATSRS